VLPRFVLIALVSARLGLPLPLILVVTLVPLRLGADEDVGEDLAVDLEVGLWVEVEAVAEFADFFFLALIVICYGLLVTGYWLLVTGCMVWILDVIMVYREYLSFFF
jgi:hypothetical protein